METEHDPSSSDSNTGAMFAILTPWDKRTSKKLSIDYILSSVRKQFKDVQGAVVVAFNAPPIQGLSTTGGFQFEIEDRGSLGLQTLAKVTNEMIEKGNKRPELVGLFSSFTVNVPGLYIKLDRTKAKTLGISISAIFDTLQAYLGALYVNIAEIEILRSGRADRNRSLRGADKRR